MPFSDTFFEDLKTLSKEEWLKQRVDEYVEMTSVYHRSAIAGLVAGYSEVEPNLELSEEEVQKFKQQMGKILSMLVPMAREVRGTTSVTDDTRVQAHLLMTLRDDIDAACYGVRNSFRVPKETLREILKIDEEITKIFEDIDLLKLRFNDTRLDTPGKFNKWMGDLLTAEEATE